jgi:hypothetical protein
MRMLHVACAATSRLAVQPGICAIILFLNSFVFLMKFMLQQERVFWILCKENVNINAHLFETKEDFICLIGCL